jgi:hypothetical protein
VVHDLLGGDLVTAEVFVAGTRTGRHNWNLLPTGDELDLTREQFHPDESLGPASVVSRPSGRPLRVQAQYELLLARVRERLSA